MRANSKYRHAARRSGTVWTLCSWDARVELTELGMPAGKKSHRIAPPASEVAWRDYVRGLVDGDGSIGFTRSGQPFVSFVTASETMARFYEGYAALVTGVTRRTNRNTRHGVFTPTYLNDPAATLAGHLYQPGDLGLGRKAQRAREIASWRRPESMRARYQAKRWSPAEDGLVMTDRSLTEVAELLGRSTSSVSMRRWRLRQSSN